MASPNEDTSTSERLREAEFGGQPRIVVQRDEQGPFDQPAI
jgi:hypothetical protein